MLVDLMVVVAASDFGCEIAADELDSGAVASYEDCLDTVVGRCDYQSYCHCFYSHHYNCYFSFCLGTRLMRS